MNYKTKKIAMLGVLAALSYLSVVLINICLLYTSRCV